LAIASALLVTACAGGAPANAPVAVPGAADTPDVEPSPTPAPRAPTAPPVATAEPAPYSKLRVFVASEGPYHGGTGELQVLDAIGRGEFMPVAKIKMGGWPHNISVSPDGRWVAVANRSSHQVSIVDPVMLTEVTRLRVGKQPHGILWHPDGKTLFVAAERDGFITRIEADTWKILPPLQLGVPQHVLFMRADRPNELWFTVTLFGQWAYQDDHLRVYDLASGKITKLKVFDVHDAYFTPDGSEVWSSSSGFLDKPSDRVVVYDPIEKVVKQEIKLAGHYPFHSLKRFHDGMYYPKDTSIMLLSSHYSKEKGRNGASLLWVDWKARKVVGETPVGIQPFHMTYDPVGERVLLTSNVDGQVNVVDWHSRKVVQKIAVPKAHGIVAVGIP
jgi:DNA-binding beta-propeller fold protein YncE